MFKTDMNLNGLDLKNKKLKELKAELSSSKELVNVKTSYRDYANKLLFFMQEDLSVEFYEVIECAWPTLDRLGPGPSHVEKEKQDYYLFKKIERYFYDVTDTFKPLEELDFPLNDFNELLRVIKSRRGETIEINDTKEGEVIEYLGWPLTETLKKVYRLTERAYKDRMYYEALNEALDYVPGGSDKAVRQYTDSELMDWVDNKWDEVQTITKESDNKVAEKVYKLMVDKFGAEVARRPNTLKKWKRNYRS